MPPSTSLSESKNFFASPSTKLYASDAQSNPRISLLSSGAPVTATSSYQLSFRDSLIIASAKQRNAFIILTEGLHHAHQAHRSHLRDYPDELHVIGFQGRFEWRYRVVTHQFHPNSAGNRVSGYGKPQRIFSAEG